ncbi:hypothetical protein UCMB321_1535 [Pseudomonas batumici]|uniref:Uncharacterized protein n=1 Tax=Pseudomonas batumici TaxID=226910 RepID=A0A0C2I683_9PSED|nr:hypothetical protein UCMB321_1535 [Pseudomonas batumici]
MLVMERLAKKEWVIYVVGLLVRTPDTACASSIYRMIVQRGR